MGKPRILAIRGGAIGDFILTLPALRMLRETFAHCELEILGYRHIAALALHGGPVADATYADKLRDIEAGPLAGFFARRGNLDPAWCEYFAGFNQIVSWLYDPDGIFAANLERAGVRHQLSAYAKITDDSHASAQLAHGLQSLALYIEDPAARLVPTPEIAGRAASTFDLRPATVTALHAGSGSPRKNWPLQNWLALARALAERGDKLLLIGGEADHAALDVLTRELAPHAPLVARGLPLPELAALLARCARYFGHDTGISHLAAAVGTPSTLLFGPTDPAVWAPQGGHVRVISAPDGDLARLEVATVLGGP